MFVVSYDVEMRLKSTRKHSSKFLNLISYFTAVSNSENLQKIQIQLFIMLVDECMPLYKYDTEKRLFRCCSCRRTQKSIFNSHLALLALLFLHPSKSIISFPHFFLIPVLLYLALAQASAFVHLVVYGATFCLHSM